MKKEFFIRAGRGFLAGVAFNCALCLASSFWLRLGYYAPCFVALTEPCGGELNAALAQALAFGLSGTLVSAVRMLLTGLRKGKRKWIHCFTQR